jgi:energy-coupling factor transport system ATP-binding protein
LIATPSNQPLPAAVIARGWGWRHAGRAAASPSALDFRIQPGERVLLLGASGAGKSTLVAALAGVLGDEDDGDESGELLIDGRPATKARGRVGLVLQDPDSQVILAKVGDDIAFGCENLGIPRDEIWRRVRESADAVGLDVPLDHPTERLSGGQKQRLALAGVLAMRPGLLLLDEPTANLDPVGVAEVRDAVARVLGDRTSTLIVIEHRVDVWIDLVDRVIVLGSHGGILADGAPREVLARQGAALAAQGVWVPGRVPEHPSRSTTAGRVMLSTETLAIARAKDAPLRSNITVELRESSALAITGPNGSGKSTLGLTLGGLLAPASGRVVAHGVVGGASSEPHRWKSRELVGRIGSVFQDPEHQFITGTVRDELAVGPRVLKLSTSETIARTDEFTSRLRLEHLLEANPFTLSGGEKRRLSVATALITRPPVLILDEPTFGQDARTWTELVSFLSELLDAGSALAAISHDVAFVDAIANARLDLTTARDPEAVR